MNSGSHFDNNIPVLTEVISVDEITREATEISEELALPETQTQQPAGFDPYTLEQLEQTLRENVLRQLLGRVDFVLEHRVRDSLADVLQTAVESLAQDIRAGLALSLEEVVRRAINQELSKLQSTHPKN